MENEAKVISLRNVNKNFKGVQAVNDVSFDVAYGERHLLLGTNGAGKTTLFNLIAGDLPASSGEIFIFGQEVSKMSMQQRVKLGLRRTYQGTALFSDLTIRQNLYLALMGTKSTFKQVNTLINWKRSSGYTHEIEEVAHKVGLADKMDALASSLSHGESRQLEFGLAIITKPKLLLLDEPSSGVSENERQNILAMIQSIEKDVTVLLIEHNMELAFAVADIVTVMFNGEVVASGKPEDIQKNEYVQRIYLGGVHGDDADS